MLDAGAMGTTGWFRRRGVRVNRVPGELSWALLIGGTVTFYSLGVSENLQSRQRSPHS